MQRSNFQMRPLLFVLSVFSAVAIAATPRTLLVGVYASEDGAKQVFDELKDVQKAKVIDIDSFAIVSKNADGQVTVRDTRHRDARWGAVAGGILGLMLMGPAGAAIGGTLTGASAGGLAGWLAGNAVGISRETIDNLKMGLEPKTSAIVAVIDNKWVADVERVMRKVATKKIIKEALKDQETSTAH